MKKIPARERWLYRNKAALASVLLGLKQSAEGKHVKMRSFAKYANLKLD